MKTKRSLVPTLLTLFVASTMLTSCAKDKKPILNSATQPIKPVIGYNKPEIYQFGVGLRAAADGNRLTISIDNRSADPVVIGPKSFRLIHHGEQIPFEYGRADISLLPITTLNPNSNEFFLVTLPEFKTLDGASVVLNYPPKGILSKAPVEQASANFEYDDSDRAFEYRDGKLLSE